MPFYDYRCASCGAAFTVRQGMRAEPVRICPECGRETVKRLMSPASVIISGIRRPACDPADSPCRACCHGCPRRAE